MKLIQEEILHNNTAIEQHILYRPVHTDVDLITYHSAKVVGRNFEYVKGCRDTTFVTKKKQNITFQLLRI